MKIKENIMGISPVFGFNTNNPVFKGQRLDFNTEVNKISKHSLEKDVKNLYARTNAGVRRKADEIQEEMGQEALRKLQAEKKSKIVNLFRDTERITEQQPQVKIDPRKLPESVKAQKKTFKKFITLLEKAKTVVLKKKKPNIMFYEERNLIPDTNMNQENVFDSLGRGRDLKKINRTIYEHAKKQFAGGIGITPLKINDYNEIAKSIPPVYELTLPESPVSALMVPVQSGQADMKGMYKDKFISGLRLYETAAVLPDKHFEIDGKHYSAGFKVTNENERPHKVYFEDPTEDSEFAKKAIKLTRDLLNKKPQKVDEDNDNTEDEVKIETFKYKKDSKSVLA